MKKELRDKWVAALRSGEYKQTRGELQGAANTYCCLGVLCRVVEKTGKKVRQSGGLLTGSDLRHQPRGFSKLLSNDHENDLIELNDEQRRSFKTIAKWIEKNVPVTL